MDRVFLDANVLFSAAYRAETSLHRLWQLDDVTLVTPAGVDLPEDDQPILAAAITMRASHLLSGDLRAFGRYFGQRLAGVLVLRPADFLRERR